MSLEPLSQESILWFSLGLIPGIGHIYAKTLLSYVSFKDIFNLNQLLSQKYRVLEALSLKKIRHFNEFHLVENEIKYIEKHDVTPLFYSDKLFPKRLLNFNDSPFLLFSKGTVDLKAQAEPRHSRY